MDALNLTNPGRREKSYVRGNYSTDTVYTFFRYRQVTMNFAKKPGTFTRLTDPLADAMVQKGLICEEKREAYNSLVCARYHFKDCHPEEAPEDIYRFICETREAVFGREAMEQAWLSSRNHPFPVSGVGIDQRAQKLALRNRSEAVIFILTQPELFSQMEADLQAAAAAGKSVYLCVKCQPGSQLPNPGLLDGISGIHYLSAHHSAIQYDPSLQAQIDRNAACIFYYGEEGLLHMRDLRIDAVVHAVPTGYHAQALCNFPGQDRFCVVYIPRALDITPLVPLTQRSRVTFYHLAILSKKHGDGIYQLTPSQLYARYPEEFVSIYDCSGNRLPFTVTGDSFSDFDRNRDQAVASYLENFSNIRYRYAYFDEDGNRQPIDYDAQKSQSGILVHSIQVTKAQNSQVMACPKGVTPRQLLAELPGPALCSNFLFFLTPKLGTLYNDLRSDRPLEQADAAAGHLDYLLENQGTERRETFPLFRKACIAMTQTGEFLFFNFRLGGGTVTLSGQTLRWEKTAVDPVSPGKLCVYTPFFSADDEAADRETYKKAVGADRVNFVILQDKVTCVRDGDVILPSVGVVLSLAREEAAPLLAALPSLGDGYYDPTSLTLQIRLDPPEGIDQAQWDSLRWVYGGGMSLIQDGAALSDGDITDWLRQDGWMTPLSRQTQESALHKLAKHPRTAIGTTQNGALVILVYSGRSSRSSGADYREMIHIARQLYPDIRTLMNVDGGGSAVLGLSCNGSFLELSIPATSTGSCTGMVRPIHTIFYIPTEKENAL